MKMILHLMCKKSHMIHPFFRFVEMRRNSKCFVMLFSLYSIHSSALLPSNKYTFLTPSDHHGLRSKSSHPFFFFLPSFECDTHAWPFLTYKTNMKIFISWESKCILESNGDCVLTLFITILSAISRFRLRLAGLWIWFPLNKWNTVSSWSTHPLLYNMIRHSCKFIKSFQTVLYSVRRNGPFHHDVMLYAHFHYFL